MGQAGHNIHIYTKINCIIGIIIKVSNIGLNITVIHILIINYKYISIRTDRPIDRPTYIGLKIHRIFVPKLIVIVFKKVSMLPKNFNINNNNKKQNEINL
jgi:hypothetical protein